MKCPKCNGLKQQIKIDSNTYVSVSCEFCWNKRELDWIEIMFGVDFDSWVKKGFKKDDLSFM